MLGMKDNGLSALLFHDIVKCKVLFSNV